MNEAQKKFEEQKRSTESSPDNSDLNTKDFDKLLAEVQALKNQNLDLQKDVQSLRDINNKEVTTQSQN